MAKKKNKKKKLVKNGWCRCCVCDREFELCEDKRITVATSTGGILTIGTTYFDAWDCDFCGAQNRLNKRYCKVKEN